MRKLIALLATFVAMFAVLGTPPALASTPPACSTANTTTGSGSCIESHMSTASSKTTQKTYAAVGTSGKILMRYNIASGIKTTAVENTSTGCKLYRAAYQRPASATCIRLVTGASYINSGVRLGQTAWSKWADSVRAPWCKFVRRGSQWYKAGCYNSTTHTVVGNCGNAVWFSGPRPALSYTQVILVQSFEQWNFSGSVAVTSSATSTATARAWCNQYGSYASATGYGYGSGKGSASASYVLKGLTKIQAWLNGKEVALNTSTSLVAQANATASSESTAVSNASAQVTCSTPPPPPSYNAPGISAQATSCDTAGHNPGIVSGTVSNPNGVADTAVVTIGSQSVTVSVPANGSTAFTMPNGYAPGTYTGSAHLQSAGTSASFQVSVAQCTPPQQTPPSIVNYTTLNDVDAGGTSPNFCATVNLPGSDQGVLTFAATYGSFQTSTFTVAGQVQKCTTYVAPTEVPSGGRDSITVYVRDNTTGLSAQSPTQSFPINTPPAPPV